MSKAQILTLQILNLLSFVAVVIANALSTTGFLPTTPPETSAKYQTRITPAGFTFSVWGIIYLFAAMFVLFQILPRSRTNVAIFQRIHGLFILSCVFNFTWIFLFGYEKIWASAVIIVCLEITLLAIYLRLNIGRSETPVSIFDYVFVQLPFSFYLAWVSLATVVNIAAALVGPSDWKGEPWTEAGWSILMMSILTFLTLLTLLTRKDGAFGLIVSWALLGVGKGQPDVPEIGYAAYTCAGVVFVLSLIALAVKFWIWRKQSPKPFKV